MVEKKHRESIIIITIQLLLLLVLYSNTSSLTCMEVLIMSIVPITILSHYLAKIFLYFVFWLAKLEYNTISKIMKAICISISILFVIALLSPTRCRRGGPRTPRRQCLFNQMQLFGGHEFFYMDKGYYLSFHSLQDLEVLTKEHYMSEIPKCPEVSGDNISYYLGHDKTICCVIHGCRK